MADACDLQQTVHDPDSPRCPCCKRALNDIPEDLSRTSLSRRHTPELSIVLPVFDEIESLRPLYNRLVDAITPYTKSFEIVFVDDGSEEPTRLLLEELAASDSRVMVVELSRNFGHQSAISAGLETATGHSVALMDADLQDRPESLAELYAKHLEGFDVVYAVRTERKEGGLKKFCYSSFYRLLNYIADVDMPLDAGDFCVMSRRVVDTILRMRERSRFLRGLRTWAGFSQIGLPVERDLRFGGDPKYTARKLVNLALDGLVSFSLLPLRLISLLGLFISIGSIVLALIYLFAKVFVGMNPRGFATTIVLLCIFAGIQLTTLGVMGEYIGRIFEEVKRRPIYVVRKVVRHDFREERPVE